MIRITFNLRFLKKKKLTDSWHWDLSENNIHMDIMTAIGHRAFGRDIQCLKSDIFDINFV